MTGFEPLVATAVPEGLGGLAVVTGLLVVLVLVVQRVRKRQRERELAQRLWERRQELEARRKPGASATQPLTAGDEAFEADSGFEVLHRKPQGSPKPAGKVRAATRSVGRTGGGASASDDRIRCAICLLAVPDGGSTACSSCEREVHSECAKELVECPMCQTQY